MPSPVTTPTLEVRGLYKQFPGVVALDHVSLSAYPGEIHALIGENGAGKSTLLKILGGVLSADAGEILVDGQPVKLRTPLDSRKYGINQVPQDISVMPNLSAAENIHIGAELVRGPWVAWGHTMESAACALERVGATFDPRTPVWQLSTAQQQLVVIARAIAREGKVLVLDEPTSSLGAKDSEKLLDVLCKLRQGGMAIIYISHRLNEIYSLSDRITVLHDGHVMDTLDGEDISTQRVIGLMSQGALTPKPSKPTPQRLRRPRLSDAPAAPPLLEVRDLTDGQRVKPTSFRIGAGEIVGLSGLIGSGRSRLSRLLCGADRHQGGSIWVNGKPCDFQTPAQAIQAGIAYVPENHNNEALFPQMSVRDNVTLGLVAHRAKLGILCDEPELQSRYAAAAKQLNIELPASGLWARGLSGGTRQKLLLARGLVLNPLLLILDEPTKGLDAASKRDVEAVVATLASMGTAILWVSTEVSEVVRVCHRVLVMCEGEIRGALDPAHGDDFSEEQVLTYATGMRNDGMQKAW